MTEQTKRAIIVTGFESSGSVFLAKIVSHVVGASKSFDDWNGYGWNGTKGDDLIILHRSLPYERNPKKWLADVQKEIETLEDYEKEYVICTRDLTISRFSRQARFGGSIEDYQKDDDTARANFAEIMETERFFVFSFESATSLGLLYYRTLYTWLGADSSFDPPVFDANAPYVKKRYYALLKRRLKRFTKPSKPKSA